MIIYYMTMTPFYQIRSREQEKSESGLHGKCRICPRLYRFFWCSWVSRDVINFTGGQLQIDTLS